MSSCTATRAAQGTAVSKTNVVHSQVLLASLVVLVLVLVVSDGCATAAGPRDQRLKHDGRSLPAPFLPVKVGSADFPMEKGGTMFFCFDFPSSIC